MYFYPRPPRGGRHENEGVYENEKEFLSTPSARRATKVAREIKTASAISIHALREEGDDRSGGHGRLQHQISIHALREEGDDSQGQRPGAVEISIHALREEGDAMSRQTGHGTR